MVGAQSESGQNSGAPERVARGRKLLAAGGLVQTAGLGLIGTSGASVGSWVLLAGWVLLVYGLHVYGRAGEEITEKSA